MSHSNKDGVEFVEYGSGSHFDAAHRDAAGAHRAQPVLVHRASWRPRHVGPRRGAGSFASPIILICCRTVPHRRSAAVSAPSSASSTPASRCWPASTSPSAPGLDFLVLDQTRPDIDVPVVRVIVPGMRHFYRRFGPGRLYDVPVKLGWLDRPIAGEPTSIRCILTPEVLGSAPRRSKQSGRRRRQAHGPAQVLSVRLLGHVALKRRPAGEWRGHSTAVRSRFGTAQRRVRLSARALCALACRWQSFAAPKRSADKEVDIWSGGWPRAAWSNTGCGHPRGGGEPSRHRAAASGLLAADRRGCATPIRSFCRDLPICGGAPTKWCWNRRAPARCSRSAIRRSPRLLAALATPQKVKTLRRQAGFPGHRAAGAAARLRRSCSRSPPRTKGCGRPKATTISSLWDFHDLLFHARSTEGRHANPVGGHYALCGHHRAAAGDAAELAGREDRSRGAFVPRRRKNSRRPQSSSMNAIRRATSTTAIRSRLPNCRAFSTPPRASIRRSKRRSTRSRSGRRRSDAHAYDAALSVGRRELRARALSRRRQM